MIKTDGKSKLSFMNSSVSYDTLDTVTNSGKVHNTASTYNDVVFYQTDNITGYTTTYVIFEVVFTP